MSLRLFIGVWLFCLVPGSLPCLRADDPPDVVRVLHDWQQASADTARPTIDRDFAQYAGRLSAHELEAAAEFCGSISARDLIHRYSWTATTNDGGQVVLTAIPRDELGQLFFGAVEIEFADGSARPTQLRFRDSENRARPVAIKVPTANAAADEQLPLPTAGGDIRLTSSVSVEADGARGGEPRIADVLTAWESATRKIRRADIEFVRCQCDHLVGVEKRSEGRFHFEQPDRGVYELRTADIADDAKSRYAGADGRPYAIEADKSTIVFWDNSRVTIAYPALLTYDEFPAPKPGPVQPAGVFDRLAYSLTAPQRLLPATVDVHSDEFLERLEWSVLSRDTRRLIIQGRPIVETDPAGISDLQVILDPVTHLAQATRMTSRDGQLEVVHVFKRIAVNDDVTPADWRPDLSTYAKNDLTPLAPPAEDEPMLLGAPSQGSARPLP